VIKEELKQIVDMIHGNWNINPMPGQIQTIYRTWFSALEEIDFDIAERVVLELIKEDGWAPRAGTVYRRAKEHLSTNPPQSPALAWESYRTLAAQVDTGVWEEGVMHPVLKRCINLIGGYHLHTNSDREHFNQIYTELVNEEYR
jgi:hypothetical protein